MLIAGVDEAGRGPLAGPVTVAAVILSEKGLQGLSIALDDSKKLSESKRHQLETAICEQAKIAAISAASILAKNARDRVMQALHRRYPEYGFDRHKGYGTKWHLQQLAAHGPCPVHRRSFAPVQRFFQADLFA